MLAKEFLLDGDVMYLILYWVACSVYTLIGVARVQWFDTYNVKQWIAVSSFGKGELMSNALLVWAWTMWPFHRWLFRRS